MKVLKPGGFGADKAKEMGAPAVTTTPLQPVSRLESPRIRRTGIWLSVVGGVLTLIGAVTVLVIRDGSEPAAVVGNDRPALAGELGPDGTGTRADGTPVTTTPGVPAVNRATGTIGAGGPPGAASPTAPPPATPQEVAELLAGLPFQLEQAASSSGQPSELTPEEVNKIVDDLLRQLGAK